MEFRILGPVEVLKGGRRVEIGGPKLRSLLVVLLLRANEAVSQDELIDALWEEAAPPTAAKTLQAHVSRLRKALGDDAAESTSNGRLETRGHGYLLHVGAGELDADAFAATLEAARGALAEGDPKTAKEGIREALALWRGGPLADVAYESFAQAEIQRLEELRIAAQEEWFEAELALGRHAEIVPELKRQLRAHPLRERLLAQFMIALYRSDRQAEALQAYEQGRRAFAEELGLEPSKRLRSLERRILEHDPQLAAPSQRGRPPQVPASVWRHPRPVVLLGAVAVIVAIAVAVLQASVLDSGTRSLTDVEGNAVAALDIRSGHVEEAVASPAAPTAIAVGYGFVWAASADGANVVVVDPKTNTIRDTIPVESAPGGIALGGGWVWVTNSLTGTVSQISPRTLSVVQPSIRVGNGPTGIAADGRYVWVANTSDHTVTKLRASDGRLLRTFPAGPDPGAVAVGESAVWVASKLSSAVLKLNPSSGEVVDRIPVGAGPAGIAVSGGSVWVASSLSGTVSRIDPHTGDVRRIVDVGSSADAIAVSGGSAWVASALSERLVRIPAHDGPMKTIAVSDRPTALAASGGTIYAGFRPSGASHFGGTLRLLFSIGPGLPALDPANAYDPDWWRSLILTNDGLVGWRRTGGQAGAELVPDLAVSLPTVSADRRTYTFQLRRGIRYSDGRLVKASDVRYSFERLYKLKSTPQSPAVDFYRAIVGADRCAQHRSRCDLSRGIVTDDDAGTVSFRLATVDPEFLFKLAASFASVLPAGTSLRAAGLRPLPATGPYRVASASRTGSVRLVRNPHFEEWSGAAQPRGFPDEILIRPVAEDERAEQTVAKGKADYVGTDPGGRARIAPVYETQLHIQPLAATFYLVLDTTHPPFDDVRARRALNFAVDRSNVVRLADETVRATCQVLPPNFPAFTPYCPYTLGPSHSTWRAPDGSKAAALMRASGTTGAHVELWWHRGFGEQIGRYLEQVLDSLGYRVRLRLFSDYGPYFTGLHASGASWQIAGTAWFADYPAPSNFIRLLSCSSADNYGRFCNEGIDRRIERAFRLQERDPAAANQAWAALDRDLTNDAPWIPLYTPYSGDFVSKRVGNYQKHPFFGPLFGQFWVR
jgi:ABC-type transport system substrate-binding protein/DNA-binding SARP family transcriptional activator/DNA-binding beta-propeller fold protein YncE